VSELPPRPSPPRSASESARAWIDWFGITRLVATAIAVVVVVGGAWLLVRTPPPAAEATLPVTSGAAPASTLAVPTTTLAIGASTFVVHVAGAVAVPGVYDVDAPARVVDAIDAAGGPSPDAELDSLNLAAPLVDGQRIYVPVVGEIVPPVPDGSAVADEALRGPIDLNTATAAELEELPGVGPATAAAIVEHRDENGPFASVDDLTDVSGIGPAKLDAIRDLVRV
jgi:competence protein ComEA